MLHKPILIFAFLVTFILPMLSADTVAAKLEVILTPLVTHDNPAQQKVVLSSRTLKEWNKYRLEVWGSTSEGEHKIADKKLRGQEALPPAKDGSDKRSGVSVLLPEPKETIETRWVLLDGADQTVAETRLRRLAA